MTSTRLIMGMPITVAIPGEHVPASVFEEAFSFLEEVDRRFSPYLPDSETSRIARGELSPWDSSDQMQEVLDLADQTRMLTDGYFDAWFEGGFDPSGIVKGWSIRKAAWLVEGRGYRNFCIDAAGDIEVRGVNREEKPWEIGIRNPFQPDSIIKVLHLADRGIATSGTYIRGEHIYDPVEQHVANDIASMTVVGPDVYEADRLATAAYAMGERGIAFLASLPGIDGYMVDQGGTATFTPGLARYMN